MTDAEAEKKRQEDYEAEKRKWEADERQLVLPNLPLPAPKEEEREGR